MHENVTLCLTILLTTMVWIVDRGTMEVIVQPQRTSCCSWNSRQTGELTLTD